MPVLFFLFLKMRKLDDFSKYSRIICWTWAPAPCPHPGQLVPLFFVLHLLLHFVDPLQRLQTLIEQERCVVYQHVYIADKLLPRTEKQLHGTQSHIYWQRMWWQVPEKNGLHPSATHIAAQSHQPWHNSMLGPPHLPLRFCDSFILIVISSFQRCAGATWHGSSESLLITF